MTHSLSNWRRFGAIADNPRGDDGGTVTVLRPGAAPVIQGQTRDAEAAMREEIAAAVRVIRNLPRLMRDDLASAPPHVRTAADASLDAFAGQAERIEAALRRHSDLAAIDTEGEAAAPDAIAHIATMRGLAVGRRIEAGATMPRLRLPASVLQAAVNALIDAGLAASRADPGGVLTLRALERRGRVRLSLLHDASPPPVEARLASFVGPEAEVAMTHLWRVAARCDALLEIGPGPAGSGTRITLDVPDRAR